MKNAVLQGNIADKDIQIRLPEDQVHSLKETGASMAALICNPHDVISQDFQDKMNKMAENFKNYSSNSPDIQVPTTKSVCIIVSVQRGMYSWHRYTDVNSPPPP